jgi:hypothetical protein
MKSWFESKLPAYMEAKPKPAFVDAHIVEFLIAHPQPGMSEFDWSQKGMWTWDELQEKLDPHQRTIFRLWHKVRDCSRLTDGPSND